MEQCAGGSGGRGGSVGAPSPAPPAGATRARQTRACPCAADGATAPHDTRPTAPHGAGEASPATRQLVAKKPAGGPVAPPTEQVYKGAGPHPTEFRLPANVRRVAMQGGGATLIHPDGRRWVVDQNNHVRAYSRPGMVAKFGEDGRLSSVQFNRPGGGNTTVTRSVNGERESVGVRPGGVVVVSHGKNWGYVQRPYPGRSGYFERTTLMGGHPSTHVFRAYRYQGITYLRYVPARYYPPQFYAWAIQPWPQRVAYTWVWGQAPWLGFYRSYFSPARAYTTAALWLTDFLLAANLKLAYDNQQEYLSGNASAASSPGADQDITPLGPEIKAAVAQGVRQQLTDEQTVATQPGAPATSTAVPPPPPVLDSNQRTLLVSENVNVTVAGQPCTLTPGDIIYRTGDNFQAGGKVAVNILTSKGGDCPANNSTEIEVSTLQDMHNQVGEGVDAGMDTLAESEGDNGLPPGPTANARPVPEGTVTPDRDALPLLADQQKESDAAEVAATNGANGS